MNTDKQTLEHKSKSLQLPLISASLLILGLILFIGGFNYYQILPIAIGFIFLIFGIVGLFGSCKSNKINVNERKLESNNSKSFQLFVISISLLVLGLILLVGGFTYYQILPILVGFLFMILGTIGLTQKIVK